MKWTFLFLAFLLWTGLSTPARSQNFHKITHIFIIYQENWSFDALYGKFPGAEGFDRPNFQFPQVDAYDRPLTSLPQPLLGIDKTTYQPIPDTRFPAGMKVAPYDLSAFVKDTAKTGDLVHRFYQEQEQIDGGKMDKFVSASDNGGLVLSYFDASKMPEGQLAKEYTLCDHYFQGAFGGSLLNHIYFITADTLTWKDAPQTVRALLDKDGHLIRDGFISPDGYLINNCQSANIPHDPNTPKEQLLPASDVPTIGDRLSDKNISWAWYAEDFDEAVEAYKQGKSDPEFEYHHQPFAYFKNFANDKDYDQAHLKDLKDFEKELNEQALPLVSWIKADAENDEHPGYSDIAKGQNYVANLVEKIKKSKYWKDCVILITYDDYGGRFDHVVPPKRDWLGPGVRLPLVVVSPFAKKHYVDHQVYDAASILKFITEKWDLVPLNDRVKKANRLDMF